MKILNLLILNLTFLSFINGQITLTAESSIPQPGSIFSYIKYNSNNLLSVGSSGTNVTWDLSSLTGNNIQIEYPNIENSHYKVLYPEAGLAEVGLHFQDNIFKVSSTEISYLGHFGNGNTIKYSDERKFLQFPLSYNTSYIDTFSGIIDHFGVDLQRTGTVEIIADGFGSLKLPYGTIDNVLRILVVTKYKDQQFEPLHYKNFVDSVYLWYNLYTNNKIASYNVTYDQQGYVKYLNAIFLAESDIKTGLISSSFNLSSSSIYPNPTTGIITLEANFENPKTLEYQIYNSLGQPISKKVLGTRTSINENIDLTDSPAGIYFIRLKAGDELKFYKIILE